ncbi:MAG: MerC domain-containing protein [Verrucomicrobiota bacterium]
MVNSSNPVQAVSGFRFPWNADRFGVAASVLCAIHCAATPFLLLILPTFGKVWSHPASHWLMALIVIPIAGLMMTKGYKRTRRKWIVLCGTLGILFIIVGAAAPYFESSGASTGTTPVAAQAGEAEASCESCDSCCPSIQTDENGESRLHIPLASILTTIGGLFLIATHVGNLCSCRECQAAA